MPKVIDPDQRKDAIADALFDVLREGGLEAVTLGSVAARAGLAIGSVRHFLGSRDAMVSFAFATMAARTYQRVAARAAAVLAELDDVAPEAAGRRLAATADILCELLPLDEARLGEAIVWIEFEAAARTNHDLAETSKHAAAQTIRLIETILTAAADHGRLTPGTDLPTETARLSALIDGLTLRTALHPDLLDPDLARQVVITHLRVLSATTAETY